ncbi:hypothetical protein RIF23_08725 [Lipingzhangella sp. LS1_29]|uniref:Uncharacterized protein n=2 Tax=Lipingzhangella rawalii TaxID=2055835 RepID=A0ABU2H4Z8_9ACTN|nr:hypothetical protein [Lipingzhangella rawalii]
MRTQVSRIDTADVLRLRPAELPPAPGQLVLWPADQERVSVPVPVPTQHNAGELTADLSGAALTVGTWEVFVTVDGQGTQPVHTEDPGLSLADWSTYLTGPRDRELRVVRAPDGRLLVRMRPVRPYVEVSWIEVDDATITLTGTLAYTRRERGHRTAVLLARHRGTKHRVRMPAEVADGTVRAHLPVTELCSPPTSGSDAADTEAPHGRAPRHGTNRIWDVWLCPDDGQRSLRLGTHADDIPARKKQLVLPAARPSGAWSGWRIQPYYTMHNEFALRVAGPDADGHGDVTPAVEA